MGPLFIEFFCRLRHLIGAGVITELFPLHLKIKKSNVTTQFVPLNTNFKQDVIQEMGKMNTEPVLGVHSQIREETRKYRS